MNKKEHRRAMRKQRNAIWSRTMNVVADAFEAHTAMCVMESVCMSGDSAGTHLMMMAKDHPNPASRKLLTLMGMTAIRAGARKNLLGQARTAVEAAMEQREPKKAH